MIQQLAHLCLGTRNLPQTLKFYNNILGFKIAHEYKNEAGEIYGVFLACGNRTFLELFADQEDTVKGGLYRHMCFEVTDLQAHVGNLKLKGLMAEIRRGRSDKTLLAEIKDPDGNTIEFHQYDEQSALRIFLDS
jgi:catechol 2,3-dioxygenase-like lactoylglutathione lyase family enzyme